jgi:methanethiol S-methyltransferase
VPLLRWLTGTTLGAGGLALGVWAWRCLGTARFVGAGGEPPALVLGGPYRYVRHPFYAGVLACFLGAAIGTGTPPMIGLLAAAGIAVAAVVPFEERRLLARFGEAYRRYRLAAPALLPRRRCSR